VEVGLAGIDITPAPGVPLAGYAARTAPSTANHDPIEVRAVAVGGAGEPRPRSVVAVADLVGLEVGQCAAIAARVAEVFGIPSSAVSVAVTHTHSGPFAAHALGGAPEPGYVERVTAATLKAATTAWAHRRVATVRTGARELPGITFNRRSEPHLDELVRVVCFDAPHGTPVGVVLTFPCHPVVLGPASTEVSSDWPGVARQVVAERLGCPVVFLQGCCGDLNTGHRPDESTLEKAGPRRSFAEAARIGAAVGEAAVAAALDARAHPGAGTSARTALVELASAAPEADEPVSVPVAFHQWAGAGLVLLPCEPFVQLAIDIRAACADDRLLVGGYAGGVPGYLPYPPDVYDAGGYEVDEAHHFYNRRSAFGPGAGISVRDTAIALVAEGTNTKEEVR
jgi:hypothetical protein